MSLPDSTLRSLAAQASTLDERLRGHVATQDHGAPTAVGARRLARWRQALGRASGPERLERRLAWEGLQPERAHVLLGDAWWPEERRLPTWAEFLAEALDVIDPVAATDVVWDTGAVPFTELLQPLIAVARRAVTARAARALPLVTPEVLADATDTLRRHLAAIAGPTLLAEFDVFRVRRGTVGLWPGTAPTRDAYTAFVGPVPSARLLATVTTYPVLGRLLATRALLWVESTAELLLRLAEDAPVLTEAFGLAPREWPAARLRGGLSDSHRGGRSVATLSLSGGRRLMYKPRPLAVERAWNELMAWVDAERAGPAQRCLRVVDRGTHGWVEFAEPRECADAAAVDRYFHRAGGLLCLAYVFGASDLHLGNVIASGEHPVLVDLEVLFASPPDWVAGPRDEGRWYDVQQLWDSVLRSGLLPQRFRLAGDRFVDLAGLTGSGDGVAVRSTEWTHVNTDAMALRHTEAPMSTVNLPRLDGAAIDAVQGERALVAGFAETYEVLRRRRRSLLAPGGPVAAFQGLDVRVVLRTTDIYAALLDRTLHPRYLRTGVERSIELDALSMGALADGLRPELGAVTAAERRGLEQLDVPLFTACVEQTRLRDDEDCELATHAPTSGYADATRRISNLSRADRQRQTDLVTVALRTASRIESRPGRPAPDALDAAHSAVWLAAAGSIVDDLRAALLPDAAEGHWMGFVRLPDARLAGLREVGPTLKDGGVGIALFLAAYARVVDDAGARSLALQALAGTVRALETPGRRRALAAAYGIGGAGGMGGIVYALATAGTLLGDASLLRAAALAARTITRARVGTDRALDSCYGAAGAALGLLALHARTGEREHARQAAWCGARLLATAAPVDAGEAVAWQASGDPPVVGVAHGGAGIALALRRLAAVLGDDRLLAAARRAQPPVRRALGEAVARAVGGAVTGADHAWCRGASGIGLVSAAAAALGDDDPTLGDDVDAACAVATAGELGPTDHPCCGTFGRVELLLAARARRPETEAQARTLAAAAVARAARRGFSTGAQTVLTPGFYQGVAGIGYQLLRLARPDVLPSVMLWEAP